MCSNKLLILSDVILVFQLFSVFNSLLKDYHILEHLTKIIRKKNTVTLDLSCPIFIFLQLVHILSYG